MERKLVRVAETVLELESLQAARWTEKLWPTADLLKLDENENTVGPSPKVNEAISEYFRSRPLNWYRGNETEERLKERLSEHLSLPKEAISCFGAPLSALECIARTYLEPGVEALLDSPFDKRIATLAQSTGAEVTEIKHSDPIKPHIEEIVSSVGPKTRVIFLTNPNEFNGAAYTESEIVFLLAYAERVMVVMQEEFVEFCHCSMAELVTRFPNLVIIRSFAKAFGLASLEAGYLLTDPENLEFIGRLKAAYDTNPLACVAACAALEDLAHVMAYTDAVSQSKRIVMSYLPQIGYEFHLGPTNFVLLKVTDPKEATRLLAEENILVYNLGGHEVLNGFIRITLGTPAQMEKLLLALGRMAKAIATGFNRNRSDEREKARIGEMVRV